MRSMLRNLFLAPAALAAMSLTATSAMAATSLNVPFSFTANGRICPAGQYQVAAGPQHSIVTLSSAHGEVNFAWLMGPGEPAPGTNKVALQFDRSGDTYELRQVQVGSMVTSRLDRKTHRHENYAPSRVIEGQ